MSAFVKRCRVIRGADGRDFHIEVTTWPIYPNGPTDPKRDPVLDTCERAELITQDRCVTFPHAAQALAARNASYAGCEIGEAGTDGTLFDGPESAAERAIDDAINRLLLKESRGDQK